MLHVEGEAIKPSSLFCKRLPDNTNAKEFFRVTSDYFEQGGLERKNCEHLCTDGAKAKLRDCKCFVIKIREKQPDIVVAHWLLHRETLVAKTMPAKIASMLDNVVNIVNFVKTRFPKRSTFANLLEKKGAVYTNLLLDTRDIQMN